MGKILITGATGELGGLTLEHLMKIGNITNEQLVALARRQNENLSNKGIEIRYGDYDDCESLDKAFQGIEKLLVISSPCLDNAQRLQQLFNVIMSAKKNNVEHIVYVGLADAEKRLFGLEDVDMAIEHMILALGIPFTFMRNPVYLNELSYDLQVALKTGKLISATQGKGFSYVIKHDLALANATVLSEEGHLNKIYDLSSNELMTYPEMAVILSDIAGSTILYEEKIAEDVINHLVDANVDKESAESLVNSFQKLISESHFTDMSNDLAKLLGENISSKKDAILSLLDSQNA